MVDTGLIRICESAALIERGAGVRFSLVDRGVEREAFVVRYRGRAVAYLNRCAHVGLELDWIAGQFLDGDGRRLICAAHGALYDPNTGACAEGPCAGHGGLVPVPVLEVDGAVYWRRDADSASA
jgi:nitrite reductase/ring-hydroxylating ferredoxin subunit